MAQQEAGITGRDMLAFAAGAILTLVASRVAPPFAGQAIGSARAMAGGDPFDALTRDHQQLLKLLDTIEQTDQSARGRRAALLFQLKRTLTAHALAEEDVIYPMLHDDAERQDMARRLYREHADMKVRLFELEHQPKDDPAWMHKLRELRRIIEQHAHQEETSEFPALRSALGKDRTAQLLSEVQREKALVL
jgi:hemerythrin superfamily protein